MMSERYSKLKEEAQQKHGAIEGLDLTEGRELKKRRRRGMSKCEK